MVLKLQRNMDFKKSDENDIDILKWHIHGQKIWCLSSNNPNGIKFQMDGVKKDDLNSNTEVETDRDIITIPIINIGFI